MTLFLVIIAGLVLPLSMLILSLSMNEFEKSTTALTALLIKRFTIEPPKKMDPKKKTLGKAIDPLKS